MTFYSVVALDQLVTIHKRGMSSGYILMPSLDEAENIAWDDELVIVSVEIDDPDAALGVDEDAIDNMAEELMAVARPATFPEEETGLFDDFTGQPITWDEPEDLEQAAVLVQFSTTGLTWQESVEYWGTAELLRHIPPEALMLMSPIDLTEIEDKQEYREVVEAMEPMALTSLGAGFWTWLIMFMSSLWELSPKAAAERKAAEEKAEARKRRRRIKRKERRRKKRLMSKKQLSGRTTLGKNPLLHRIESPGGEVLYAFVPAPDGRIEVWAKSSTRGQWGLIATVDNELEAHDLMEQTVPDASAMIGGLR